MESQLCRTRLWERLPHLLDERPIVVEIGVLAQVAQRAVAMARTARIRILVARDQPEDRRLPGAVRPDEAHALPVPNDEVHILEDLDGAK
jgi:hypothetical protein